MEDDKLSFLLDLFESGKKHAYLSVLDFFSVKGVPYCRIEMILDNVGRLSLYQTFKELPDGEQIPLIKVFYTSAENPNLHTLIKTPNLLKRSINLVYKCKKFCESRPETKIDNDNFIIKAIRKNTNFARKIYEQNRRQYKNLFLLDFQK